jgi:hypothetical protein
MISPLFAQATPTVATDSQSLWRLAIATALTVAIGEIIKTIIKAASKTWFRKKATTAPDPIHPLPTTDVGRATLRALLLMAVGGVLQGLDACLSQLAGQIGSLPMVIDYVGNITIGLIVCWICIRTAAEKIVLQILFWFSIRRIMWGSMLLFLELYNEEFLKRQWAYTVGGSADVAVGMVVIFLCIRAFSLNKTA